jgi:nicotinate-nucleotide adenylyltransferase
MPERAEAPVCIYGGSFNPPHVAHVLTVSLALGMFDAARVVVIPTFQHPFAKSLAPFEDRLAMCERAMGWLPRVEISRVEEVLGGESRTLRTLEHLASEHPEWRMRLLMGADLVVESPKWHAFDRVKALAPPLVLGRAGIDFPGCPPPLLPRVSSTEVRAKVGAGAWGDLAHYVPSSVLEYIRARGLYTNVDD